MLSFGHPNFYRFLEPILDLADHIERRFQEIIIRCDYSLAEGDLCQCRIRMRMLNSLRYFQSIQGQRIGKPEALQH